MGGGREVRDSTGFGSCGIDFSELAESRLWMSCAARFFTIESRILGIPYTEKWSSLFERVCG